MMNKGSPRSLDVTVESQRRRQIMEAVIACISEIGFEKTTMRTVAKKAGVSTAMPLYYFHSKKELVDAALQYASQRYLDRFKNLAEGRHAKPIALSKFVERFWDDESTDTAFLVQVIELGLHNAELRSTHQAMVEAGTSIIEGSIRDGQGLGLYRDDVDPKLAAALLHSVLIWWGAELAWDKDTEEMGREVSALTARVIGSQSFVRSEEAVSDSVEQPTSLVIRTLLKKDSNLEPDVAEHLADVVESLYNFATKYNRSRPPTAADH